MKTLWFVLAALVAMSPIAIEAQSTLDTPAARNRAHNCDVALDIDDLPTAIKQCKAAADAYAALAAANSDPVDHQIQLSVEAAATGQLAVACRRAKKEALARKYAAQAMALFGETSHRDPETANQGRARFVRDYRNASPH